MVILGLDLSLSSTGFNIIDGDENIIKCDLIETNSKKNTEQERIHIIAAKVRELIRDYKVDVVVAENQFFGGNAKTGLTLSKLLGAVMYVSIEEGKEVQLLTPSQCRKILLGDGKSTKEDVAQYIRENYIDLGVYSNKKVKTKGIEKNSDLYDSLCVSLAWLKRYKLNEKYK